MPLTRVGPFWQRNALDRALASAKGSVAKPWFPAIVYFALSLVILGPLLRPGYVLSLDMVFGPNMRPLLSSFLGINEWWVAGDMPLMAAVFFLSSLLPSWLLEKVILLAILFFSGLGMHRLAEGTSSRKGYYAGMLYVCNPFVYIRLLAGHWTLLVGYAALPFAIIAFLRFLDNPRPRSLVIALIATTVVGFSPHMLVIAVLAFGLLLLFRLFSTQGSQRQPLLLNAALFTLAFLLLNTYWLLPVATAKTSILSQLDPRHLETFAPNRTSPLGIWFDVLSLEAFWRSGYRYPHQITGLWWGVAVVVIFLSIHGLISRGKDVAKAYMAPAFATLGVIVFGIIVLYSTGRGREFLAQVGHSFPAVFGMRDAQKFSAGLAFVFAWLGGRGLQDLTALVAKSSHSNVPTRVWRAFVGTALRVGVFVVPILYAPLLFLGLGGAVKSIDYPKDWYEVRQILNRNDGDYSILVLPWHLFMDFSWLPNRERRLSNPARWFFQQEALQSDDIELDLGQSNEPTSRFLDFLLPRFLDSDLRQKPLGEQLALLNVKYVVVFKEVDWKQYADLLSRQKDLTPLLNGDTIMLFENQHSVARLYQVGGASYVSSQAEALALTRAENLLERVYVLRRDGDESLPVGDPKQAFQRIAYKTLSPALYLLEQPVQGYLVAALPQRDAKEGWKAGERSVMNLGVMPAFYCNSPCQVIYLPRAAVHLVGYAISFFFLVFLLVRAFRSSDKTVVQG